MTNSYDVAHGLSQVHPGPEEPVEVTQQDDTLARTGNTARDQEMYVAGIRTGEENTKHNAAIRAGVPDGWKLLAKKTCYVLMHDGAVIATLAGPESEKNAAIIARMLAAPGVSTVEDAQDERQAFEAWAEDQGFVLDCDFFEVSGQYYDQDDTQLAYDIWRAARASVAAPAAGDALDLTLAQKYEDACILANANARDAERWRAYAAQFPEISAAFLAVHAVDGGDPLPTIKGASITGGYVVVTPAGWDADKATKLRDAILRLFPVNPAHTPRPSDELAAQRKGDA